MSNPAKARGSAWERDCARFMDLERMYGAGRHFDVGDLAGDEIVAYECKAARAFSLAKWIEEARVEARNAKKPFGVVVIKRDRLPTKEAYVVMRLEDFRALRGLIK